MPMIAMARWAAATTKGKEARHVVIKTTVDKTGSRDH